MVVKTSVPFDLMLEVVNPINVETNLIQVDYNNVLIRCRYCLSILHLIKNCPSILEQRKIECGASGESKRDMAPKAILGEKNKVKRQDVVIINVEALQEQGIQVKDKPKIKLTNVNIIVITSVPETSVPPLAGGTMKEQ